MKTIYQTTLSNPVSFKGIGLHSGLNSVIKLLPADENHGIVFKRVDIEKNNLVEAKYQKVTSSRLCTTLENDFGVKISTVEHLLAALYIAGIDNVLIEINNEEVPIMDGSAKEFLEILTKQELLQLSEKRKFLKVLEKFEIVDGERKISIEPTDESFEVEFKLNYKNKIIGKQSNSINFDYDDIQDIYNSRTFCLFEDIEQIKKAGLAKGGSLENAIVVDEEKILNNGGLRNEKEFVNHKILDLLGDFVLSGYRIVGKINCNQGGHQLTNMFLRKLLKNAKIEEFYKIKKIGTSEKLNPNMQVKIAVTA